MVIDTAVKACQQVRTAVCGVTTLMSLTLSRSNRFADGRQVVYLDSSASEDGQLLLGRTALG